MVTANVVRAIAAVSGPAAISARVSSRAGAGRRWPAAGAARAGACGASRRNSSTVGVGSAGRHRRAVEPQDRPGQPGGRADPGRGRGVAAAALDPQLERGGALLGDADRRRSGRPRRGTPRARSRRPRRGRTTAGRRGVRARRRPRGAPVPNTSSSQPKESQTSCAGVKPARAGVSTASQIADQAALVVEGAAAPDRAVDDRRRRTAGAARARLVDRDDVEVRHQHDRPRRRSRRASGRAGRGCATRVSSSRSCSSGNWRASSARNASNAAVSTRVGVAVGDGRDPDQRLQLRTRAMARGQRCGLGRLADAA